MNSSTKIPDTIYHYCSMATFMSIVENHSFWLTDTRCMNDTLEGKWIIKRLEKIHDKESNKEKKTYILKRLKQLKTL